VARATGGSRDDAERVGTKAGSRILRLFSERGALAEAPMRGFANGIEVSAAGSKTKEQGPREAALAFGGSRYPAV
jgi:hypothetical protein